MKINKSRLKINAKTIGERIKQLRLSHQWSQLELAKNLKEVDNRQISNYENGKTFPAVESLIYLSDIFDVSIDYLLLGELNGEATQKLKDKELLGLFEKVDRFKDEDKRTIKNVIQAFTVKSKIDEIPK